MLQPATAMLIEVVSLVDESVNVIVMVVDVRSPPPNRPRLRLPARNVPVPTRAEQQKCTTPQEAALTRCNIMWNIDSLRQPDVWKAGSSHEIFPSTSHLSLCESLIEITYAKNLLLCMDRCDHMGVSLLWHRRSVTSCTVRQEEKQRLCRLSRRLPHLVIIGRVGCQLQSRTAATWYCIFDTTWPVSCRTRGHQKEQCQTVKLLQLSFAQAYTQCGEPAPLTLNRHYQRQTSSFRINECSIGKAL
jgi:hypothetical protein